MPRTADHDHLADTTYLSERFSECTRCGVLIDWDDEDQEAAPAAAPVPPLSLDDLPTVPHPAPGHRVSRCWTCGAAFTWKGQRVPGCIRCGGNLSTTTRRLRTSWHVLEGPALDLAETLPGGLPASITWHRDRAARYTEQANEWDALVAAGEARLDPETGITWRGHSGHRVEGLRREAAAQGSKADRLARRLSKLEAAR